MLILFLTSSLIVPPKGVSEGWEERNVILGEAWTELPVLDKEVFSSSLRFHVLMTTTMRTKMN
jgi:hypothetical protein